MSSSIGGLSASTLYPLVSKNEQADVTKFEGYDPTTKAAIALFQQQAPSITSPEALLGNYRALQVVLGAFGMSSAIGETALLKQLMTQDPSSSSSLAQQLGNPSYQRFANLMSQWNPPPFSSTSAVAVITGQYATNAFEAAQGKQAPGLQQALYFTRTIGSATTLAGVMSDPTLLKVVETVTGQPQQFGLLDYTQQVRILTKAVDVTKFQDPKYVDQYVQQYLAMNSASQPGSTDPTLALFGIGSSTAASTSSSILGALYPSAAGTGTAGASTSGSGGTGGGIGSLFSAIA